MSVYLSDADFTLYNGDAREVLRELPDESVHMCVTQRTQQLSLLGEDVSPLKETAVSG